MTLPTVGEEHMELGNSPKIIQYDHSVETCYSNMFVWLFKAHTFPQCTTVPLLLLSWHTRYPPAFH